MTPLHLLKIEDKPTPSVTVNNEGPNSHIESQVDTEKALDIGKAQDTEKTTESSSKSAKKQGMSTPPKDISYDIKRRSLEQEWDQFSNKLQDTPKKTDAQETTEYKTPLHVQKNTESEPMDEQVMTYQQTEIIPTLPTLEIVLKVTEIHLLHGLSSTPPCSIAIGLVVEHPTYSHLPSLFKLLLEL